MRRMTVASARQLARQHGGAADYKHPARGTERLPFTAWELETMAAALRQRAELPGFSAPAREQMRRLSTRLQLADPQ